MLVKVVFENLCDAGKNYYFDYKSTVINIVTFGKLSFETGHIFTSQQS